VLGALWARGVRVIAVCWVLVPLALLLAAELVRPVYLPRYLLAGLLGLGVLAAAGAAALPRRWAVSAGALLLACSLLACLPVLERGPRERGDDVVARLAEVHRAGEPVVAADQRSALALDHYVRLLEPGLRPDVVLPPDDAPPGAGRVWLVRRLIDGAPEPTDDDGLLRQAGLRPARQYDFPATKTQLILQLWTR
jgi:mannosyltransferase